jgi:glycosyltransferase involved in cell wall biosynthesis
MSVVEEVVIVDTGSTDDTLAVAARLGAKISAFDFEEPDFSGARNRSLERAGCEWILVLDADEVLTATAPAVIRGLVHPGPHVGYVVQRRNLRPGTTEVLTDHAVRLFPNHPKHRYRGRVHETIDAAILENGGRIRTCEVTIDHMLPAEERHWLEKSRFYLRILEAELAADPDNVDRLSFRRAELHKQGLLDEAARTAERIAALAPNDAANHLHVGLYRIMHGHDVAGAEQAFLRALELKPHDQEVIRCLRSLPRADGTPVEKSR